MLDTMTEMRSPALPHQIGEGAPRVEYLHARLGPHIGAETPCAARPAAESRALLDRSNLPGRPGTRCDSADTIHDALVKWRTRDQYA